LKFNYLMAYLLRLIALFVLTTHAGLLYAEEAGKVQRVKGTVSIINSAGTKVADKGDRVNTGERLVAAKDSEALIRLKDRSTLIVRPASEVIISEFKFEKGGDDKIKTNLVVGSLRAITGVIGTTNPNSVKYQAGTATVGIRGTDIDLAIIPKGGNDRAGVYNYVNSGEVELSLTTGESLVVPKELTGFAPSEPKEGEQRLQLLNDRPAFFQSGAFDVLMQQLLAPRIPIR
jgi:hypothetical protein